MMVSPRRIDFDRTAKKSFTQQTTVHRFLQELSMTCLAIEALLCWTEVADSEAAIQGKLTAGYPKMMGLGKGGLWLKIWPFLISMLDFWGVYKFWISYWWFCDVLCSYWRGVKLKVRLSLNMVIRMMYFFNCCQWLQEETLKICCYSPSWFLSTKSVRKRTDPPYWFQPHEKSECHETIKKPVSGDHGFHPLTWYLGFSTFAAQTCQDTCSSTGVATEFGVSWLHTDLICLDIFWSSTDARKSWISIGGKTFQSFNHRGCDDIFYIFLNTGSCRKNCIGTHDGGIQGFFIGSTADKVWKFLKWRFFGHADFQCKNLNLIPFSKSRILFFQQREATIVLNSHIPWNTKNHTTHYLYHISTSGDIHVWICSCIYISVHM